MLRLILTATILSVSLSFADYDWRTGNSTYTTTDKSGSRTLDLNTGNIYNSSFNGDGSVRTYDMDNSSYSTTKKTLTGYETYDYDNGSYSTTRKSVGSYDNSSNDYNTRMRAISGVKAFGE